MRLLAVILASVLALLAAAFGGLYYWVSNPSIEALPLPPFAVALDTAEGQALLVEADDADHDALTRAFQPQEKRSWCGVASASTVLSALGGEAVPQADFFTAETDAVRSWWQVTFGGMTLDDLAGLLRAHGADVALHRADEGLDAFRGALARSAIDADDFVIVNWHRPDLAQEGGGHISPVSAYHARSDQVLVLDVAAYRYPFAWIPVEQLYRAIDTRDGERLRGWVEVRRRR